MPWDVIRPYRHKKYQMNPGLINDLESKYELRLMKEPNLDYLKKVRNRYDFNKNKKFLSLNLEERIIQKELRKDWLFKIENDRRIKIGLPEFLSYQEMEDFNDTENSYTNDINLEDDYHLIESTNIINDYIEFEKKIILTTTQ